MERLPRRLITLARAKTGNLGKREFKPKTGNLPKREFKFPFLLRNPLGGCFSRFKPKREICPKGNLTRASIKSLRQRRQRQKS